MTETQSNEIQQALKEARKIVSCARSVVVLTGAGISAESGVPTFRGKDGLWKSYNVMELATPQAFKSNPKLVWEFYLWRRKLISSCFPNRAHYALVELEKHTPEFTLITQNVDGLHSKAGSRNVLEIHGNLWRSRCIQCGDKFMDSRIDCEIPPLCGKCGGLLRPDVVWFGETLDTTILNRSINALEHAEVLLIVGTSGVVEPAASFGAVARAAGAHVIEVNIERTPRSQMYQTVLLGRAGDILPELVKNSEV